MDIRLALSTGIDIPVPECQIILHQPKIREISYMGEDEFFIGVQTLCISKNMVIEDKTVLDQVSNFQVFMTVMNDKTTADKKESVESIFQLMGLGKIMVTPRSLVLTDKDGTHMVDEANFDALQNAVKSIVCANNGPMELMRGRQRVAAQKGNLTASAFSRYLSILSIALKRLPTELEELTMFQLYDLMERYVLYVNWDLDIRTRLAGGKPDSHPDDWMKNIH